MSEPMFVSTSHLVLIPSYNPGVNVRETVRAARAQWSPVWVVVDGSTDGSTAVLQELARHDAGLWVIVLPHNGGKGTAVMTGLVAAQAAGFTHVLTMDADGQHPADLIPAFMVRSQQQPECMVLGNPVFDAQAPRLRVYGRRLSNGWVHLETLWAGIGDSLYGFRVYPIRPLLGIMQRQTWMRRFDFDPEAVVRLSWVGVPCCNIAAPVRYFQPGEGGVSHFHYGRDNVLLTWMHARLLAEFIWRLPKLLVRCLFSEKKICWRGR